MTGHLSGAKRFKELRNTIRKIIAIELMLSGVIALLLVIFHNPIISVFSNEYVVLREVRNMLMFNIICILTFPILMGCSYVFIGLEKSVYPLLFIIFNLACNGALIMTFTHIMGMGSFGIFLAVALSSLIEAVLMLVVLKRMLDSKISQFEPVVSV